MLSSVCEHHVKLFFIIHGLAISQLMCEFNPYDHHHHHEQQLKSNFSPLQMLTLMELEAVTALTWSCMMWMHLVNQQCLTLFVEM